MNAIICGVRRTCIAAQIIITAEVYRAMTEMATGRGGNKRKREGEG